MKYQLQILKKAVQDMEKSAAWYNKQQEGLGDRFLREVIFAMEFVEANPLHYEQKFAQKFRFAQVNKFPYLIVFKIKDDVIVINSVFHTSRNPRMFTK